MEETHRGHCGELLLVLRSCDFPTADIHATNKHIEAGICNEGGVEIGVLGFRCKVFNGQQTDVFVQRRLEGPRNATQVKAISCWSDLCSGVGVASVP